MYVSLWLINTGLYKFMPHFCPSSYTQILSIQYLHLTKTSSNVMVFHLSLKKEKREEKRKEKKESGKKEGAHKPK